MAMTDHTTTTTRTNGKDGNNDEFSSSPIRSSSSSQSILTESAYTDGYYYLNEDARQKLPHYRYRGVDLSLLYHYVLSPVASFLVNTVVPETMAPNTVTSIGLLWMISAYCLYWWYVPTLEVDVVVVNTAGTFVTEERNNDILVSTASSYPPRWIFLWNGISMLAYQTLDNMDGKQARRTKSSSPLGLLFDHGCDAVNSIFGSANWIIGMNLIPRYNLLGTWALVFGPFAMFYIATWEQYYTGELIMPIVNGPNEGLLGGVLLSFTSFLYGSQYWQQTSWFDSLESSPILPFSMRILTGNNSLRNCDFVIIASSIGFLQEIVLKSISVTRRYSGSLQALIPFAVLAFSYFLVGWINPDIWLNIPRTSLHLAMTIFVEMSTEIMLAHVTAQKFNPWRWQLFPLVLLTCWVCLSDRKNDKYLQYWIVSYTFSLAAYLAMKYIVLIHEMCCVLNIWCFDIVTPYPKKILSINGIHRIDDRKKD